MPKVVRKGDVNAAGGVALGGAGTVKAEGSAVMLPGASVTPHPCWPNKGCSAHASATTKGGSSTVKCEGKPIIHTGDIDTCGHGRASGAGTVSVGG